MIDIKPSVQVMVICQFLLLLCLPASAQETPENRPSLSEIVEAWLTSPHADISSEAFTHWNEDGEVPGTCAVCHTSTGVIDYLRGDMTTAGVLPHSMPLGTSVDCAACHNSGAADLEVVPFPSGAQVATLGSSAICSVCHQGRASKQDVETATSGLEDDVIAGDLSFINIHYAPAAASLMGGDVESGYQYPGMSYKGQFTHVPNFDSCVDCHQPHSLEVVIDNCTSCHQNVDQFEDIRISPTDFDGDGETAEGISDPIRTMHDTLGHAIESYAAEIAGTPIVYADGSFPYFFIDGDGDGAASEGEAVFPNRYQSWTPRLLKAAYNYQFIAKDKGIHAHNPHYALQLLYDSLQSLSEQVDVEMTGLTRP